MGSSAQYIMFREISLQLQAHAARRGTVSATALILLHFPVQRRWRVTLPRRRHYASGVEVRECPLIDLFDFIQLHERRTE